MVYTLAVTSQAPGRVPGHGHVHGGEHLKRGDAPCTAQQGRADQSRSQSHSQRHGEITSFGLEPVRRGRRARCLRSSHVEGG